MGRKSAGGESGGGSRRQTDLANGAGVVPHACFLARSLGPGRDHGGSFHHRPLIVAGRKDAIAIGLGPFPGTAEAFLRKLPSAFALRTPRTDRLAAHLAVGAEYHLVFDVWCRGSERLTGKEGRLDFIRRKCSGKSRCGYGGDGHGGHEGGARRRSSLRLRLHHGTANRGVAQQGSAGSLSQHRWQHAVGGAVSSQEGLDVDDYLLAHVDRPSSVAEPICGRRTDFPIRASLTSFGFTACW